MGDITSWVVLHLDPGVGSEPTRAMRQTFALMCKLPYRFISLAGSSSDSSLVYVCLGLTGERVQCLGFLETMMS